MHVVLTLIKSELPDLSGTYIKLNLWSLCKKEKRRILMELFVFYSCCIAFKRSSAESVGGGQIIVLHVGPFCNLHPALQMGGSIDGFGCTGVPTGVCSGFGEVGEKSVCHVWPGRRAERSGVRPQV